MPASDATLRQRASELGRVARAGMPKPAQVAKVPLQPGRYEGVWIPDPSWSGGVVQWDDDEAPRLAHSDSLLITFGFRCNLACEFCIVEDGLDQRFSGISLEQLRAWTAFPELFRGVKRIILSGGEATLESQIFDYIAVARTIPGVEDIRIQTNATRLGRGDLLARLNDAGVTEYFVSVQAHDEPTNAAITKVPGSFKAICRGMEAIAASPARLVTNTVVVERNVEHLRAIVELIAPYEPALISLWNMHLRVDRPDTRQMQVPVGRMQPFLLEALDRADELGVPSTIKWYPRCLLDRHIDKQDDTQPTTLIEPSFWPDAPRYGCVFHRACTEGAKGCNGLSYPYIETYGWELDVLEPTFMAPTDARGATGLAATGGDGRDGAPLPLRPDELEALEALDDRLGLRSWLASAGWAPAQPQRVGDGLRFDLLGADGGLRTWLELAAADDPAPCWWRSASFAWRHGRVQGHAPTADEALAELLAGLKAQLEARDDGALRLPWA